MIAGRLGGTVVRGTCRAPSRSRPREGQRSVPRASPCRAGRCAVEAEPQCARSEPLRGPVRVLRFPAGRRDHLRPGTGGPVRRPHSQACGTCRGARKHRVWGERAGLSAGRRPRPRLVRSNSGRSRHHPLVRRCRGRSRREVWAGNGTATRPRCGQRPRPPLAPGRGPASGVSAGCVGHSIFRGHAQGDLDPPVEIGPDGPVDMTEEAATAWRRALTVRTPAGSVASPGSSRTATPVISCLLRGPRQGAVP